MQMANKRMFSARVTESARFLKMPPSSQSLYFHLGMKADDDGVVEAYPVMRMTSSTEDDLRVLVGKGFITVLNEDLVVFINDWMENNNIRADRKTDSFYKDLLLQVVPEAKIKDTKPSYYSRKKEICQTNDCQMSDTCQANVSIGKVRIDKNSLSKDSIDNNIICPEPEPTPDLSDIQLPLVDKSYYDVPLEKIEKWKVAYPAVDVKQELRKMISWLDANPKRKKTRNGVDRFINTWLSREQDKGGVYKNGTRQQACEPTTNEGYEVYRQMYSNLKSSPEDPFQ